MNYNIFKQLIIKNLNHTPTNGQLNAINELYNFLIEKAKLSVFVLHGYAGTGKTSLISALIKTLEKSNIKSILMAPTGRAAKVLTEYSGYQAFTIHKCIYRQKSITKPEAGFTLDFNRYKDTFFIVDEASMINNADSGEVIFGTGDLLNDLIEFVYSSGNNCRLIFVGDTAQLPPVNSILSPALNIDFLEIYGLKVFYAELNDVVRQSENSGILINATNIRLRIKDKTPDFFNSINPNFNDIISISGADLLENLENCFSKYGSHDAKIICRSNKLAVRYNLGIRNKIFWFENEISPGDLIMAVRNSYHWLPDNSDTSFIANGDIFEVVKVYKKFNIYGHFYADVKLKFLDYTDTEIDVKILLDTLTSEMPAFGYEYYKNLYAQLLEDYSEIDDIKKRHLKIIEDPYYNAIQVKYAYALTCHKAQGGQWKTVFVDHGFPDFENSSNESKIEFLRWLYTALTRATEKLYLINFNKKLFSEK